MLMYCVFDVLFFVSLHSASAVISIGDIHGDAASLILSLDAVGLETAFTLGSISGVVTRTGEHSCLFDPRGVRCRQAGQTS